MGKAVTEDPTRQPGWGTVSGHAKARAFLGEAEWSRRLALRFCALSDTAGEGPGVFWIAQDVCNGGCGRPVRSWRSTADDMAKFEVLVQRDRARRLAGQPEREGLTFETGATRPGDIREWRAGRGGRGPFDGGPR